MEDFDPLNARRYRINDIATHPDGSHARVLRQVGSNAHVLELGCATGAMTEALVKQGCRVVGVEVEAAAAAFAAAHAYRVIVADLETVDLASELSGELFDAVVAADVLEHLKDPQKVLKTTVPLLRPEGVAIISLPNVAHAALRLALLGGDFPYADCGLLDRTHLHMYTLDAARELVESCGLAIIDVERVVAPLDEALIPVHRERLPAGVAEWAIAQPEALTYQFVFRCAPPGAASYAGPTVRQTPSRTPPTVASDRSLLALQASAMAQLDDTVQQLRAANNSLSSSVTRLEGEVRAVRARLNGLERSRAVRFANAVGRLTGAGRRRERNHERG